ncbi:hypothetical protein BDR03DRAFT_603707 [Suillus americanus]|nr:hypothetical protein BDR03DRAFT_603707 [Suillus americanus]
MQFLGCLSSKFCSMQTISIFLSTIQAETSSHGSILHPWHCLLLPFFSHANCRVLQSATTSFFPQYVAVPFSDLHINDYTLFLQLNLGNEGCRK